MRAFYMKDTQSADWARKIWLLLLSVALLSVQSIVNAQGVVDELELENDLPSSEEITTFDGSPETISGGYWTAERLKNATPLPLPEVDPDAIEITTGGGLDLYGADPSALDEPIEEEAGQPPEAEVAPNKKSRLFIPDPQEKEVFVPDSGNAYDLENKHPGIATQSETAAPLSIEPQNIGSFNACLSG